MIFSMQCSMKKILHKNNDKQLQVKWTFENKYLSSPQNHGIVLPKMKKIRDHKFIGFHKHSGAK